MYDRRPTARNRLLALERELLARGGWSQHNHLQKGRRQEAVGRREYFRGSGGEPQKALPDSNISSDRPMQFAPPASSNNRLLDLERELRAKKQQFEESRGQELRGRREYFLGSAPEPQKRSRKQRPKTPQLSFKAYVFDTGDPIVVEYPGDPEANHLPPSHLPQLTSQSEPELVTSLSDDGKGKGNRIDEGVSTHQNGHRSTLEAIEPELNFKETSTASPSRDNSHNNGFPATFGNIGDEMKHATYFDLGEVEIEIPFDEFDREMEREQSLAKAQTAPTFEARFDEFDRDLNLGESLTKTDLPPPRERGDAGMRGRSDMERNLNLSSPPLPKASGDQTGSAIKAIAGAEGSVEVLPYGSLVWPGTSPTLLPFDFDLVAWLQPMGRGVVTLLPAIARFLLYTLAFLAALAKIFLLTLAIAICFVTRTSAEPSEEDDRQHNTRESSALAAIDPLPHPWEESTMAAIETDDSDRTNGRDSRSPPTSKGLKNDPLPNFLVV